MDSGPRYRLEALHAVLLELGCTSEQSRIDPRVRAWANPRAARPGDVPPIATFRPDEGSLTIREDHVFAIAAQLRLPDPYDVIRRLKDRGGEAL